MAHTECLVLTAPVDFLAILPNIFPVINRSNRQYTVELQEHHHILCYQTRWGLMEDFRVAKSTDFLHEVGNVFLRL